MFVILIFNIYVSSVNSKIDQVTTLFNNLTNYENIT